MNALEPFDTFGWRDGRDHIHAFDNVRLPRGNPDVAMAGVNPLEHYHQRGWQEGATLRSRSRQPFCRAELQEVLLRIDAGCP